MAIDNAMSLAMAAVCVVAIAMVPASHAMAHGRTVTVKHAPITNPGDVSGSSPAQQNVIESKQYEHLLQTNPSFRQARMQQRRTLAHWKTDRLAAALTKPPSSSLHRPKPLAVRSLR